MRRQTAAIAVGNIFSNLPQALLNLGQRMAGAAREASTFGATLVEQAEVTGLTANRLDLMRRAFEANGASTATVDAALAKFNRRLNFAVQGLSSYADAFKQLDLDPASFDNTEDALRAVMQRISELPTASERGAVAFRLFGTAAQSIQKTLNDGLPAFDAEIERQRELGEVTDVQAQSLKDLAQAFTDLKNTVQLQVAGVCGRQCGGRRTDRKLVGSRCAQSFRVGRRHRRYP